MTFLNRLNPNSLSRSSALRNFNKNYTTPFSHSSTTISNIAALSSGIHYQNRFFSSKTSKLTSPKMVYISGEEMTHYACNQMLEHWVHPDIDTKNWENFDLSCVSRDKTDDRVLHDAVKAGYDIGAIFKEPTITPSAEQVVEFGLSKGLPSPNGAMRRGWNGITISRDTIHIEGMPLGFERPVLFERHAVGGEYGAGWAEVGEGNLETRFYPNNMKNLNDAVLVDTRQLTDKDNVVVAYHNPLDNVDELAHFFFKRCLESEVVPYVVTKKTVFKWQEGFWQIMRRVFDESYRQKYIDHKDIKDTHPVKDDGKNFFTRMNFPNNDVQHLISDAATMQIVRWTGGGFGMVAHNYDGDMLTDEVSQIHRSPGFITSNLIGKKVDTKTGETLALIKEYEASHGTVSDLWRIHNEGGETSLNPLGLAEALIGAMSHAAQLEIEAGINVADNQDIQKWGLKLRQSMHACMVAGLGTRDLCGPEGLSTEQFIHAVRYHFSNGKLMNIEEAKSMDKFGKVQKAGKIQKQDSKTISPQKVQAEKVDKKKVKKMFDKYDANNDGTIDVSEFTEMLVQLGVAPYKK